jgi:hypothetical protein
MTVWKPLTQTPFDCDSGQQALNAEHTLCYLLLLVCAAVDPSVALQGLRSDLVHAEQLQRFAEG